MAKILILTLLQIIRIRCFFKLKFIILVTKNIVLLQTEKTTLKLNKKTDKYWEKTYNTLNVSDKQKAGSETNFH